MAIKSKADILTAIRDKFKDDTSDSTLSFLEDVTDTIDDFEKRASDSTDWHKKYDENDAAWREKYKERFFSKPVEEEEEEEIDTLKKPKIMKYEDLFETKKG